ncbi:vacuolar cation/proton exchanger 3-like isoform X2 [Primulina tabacum]|uniref:vacuolar cation/proton exchanger 3-like isoform X2 n=1 Tax=Primulina tabacum TaxID=48773 RepID=UPI003F59FC2D
MEAEPLLMEDGGLNLKRHDNSPTLQKRSDPFVRMFLVNIQEVLLGTKLSILFSAIPVAIVADQRNYGRAWVFALSLIGLTPLAERVSFLTEQIAFYTNPTVGGILNATCGNVTELVISLLALIHHKVDVVKYSLLGSILSNLLLVLGTALFCGGIANPSKEQKFDTRQTGMNSVLLLLGLLCHLLPLMLKLSGTPTEFVAAGELQLSRVSCVVMLVGYIVYLLFQLWTHRQLFEDEEGEDDDGESISNEKQGPVIGFWSACFWLVLMTGIIAPLSEYVVTSIEVASDAWGLSVSFISVILLPIVGNAAEHAGAIIFAFKNKLDISIGLALGSATQIALFVIPLSVLMSWIMGVDMDLDLNLLETSCLALTILVTAFTLQDGTSHYLKGVVLVLCYFVMGACFYVFRGPIPNIKL